MNPDIQPRGAYLEAALVALHSAERDVDYRRWLDQRGINPEELRQWLRDELSRIASEEMIA